MSAGQSRKSQFGEVLGVMRMRGTAAGGGLVTLQVRNDLGVFGKLQQQHRPNSHQRLRILPHLLWAGRLGVARCSAEMHLAAKVELCRPTGLSVSTAGHRQGSPKDEPNSEAPRSG